MDLLINKVAIVTGVGTGLGKATAIKLAEEGAKIILVGRRQDKLEEVAQNFEQSSG